MNKLLFTVLTIMCIAHGNRTLAQTNDVSKLSEEIFEIQIQITEKLDNLQNSNRGGNYGGKKMSDWHYVYGIEKNNALYEFYFPNENKYDHDYRYRIDLSKIGYITMGTTNAGDDGFFFYAKQGELAIQRYTKSNDWDMNIGAPSYRKDEWVQQTTILMPQDEDLLDLFKQLIVLIQKHKEIKPSEYGSLKDVEYFQNPVANNVTNTQEYATGEAIVTVLEGLSYFNWEFVGRSTFTEGPGIYDNSNKPIPYGIDDARFNLILGKNHFRFNISPLGFSWLSLPDFTKNNEQGVKIGTMANYSPRFYTPSIGLSYVFYPKNDKDDEYRIFEFPLSVHFAPFLDVKNDGYEMIDFSDSDYMAYFSDFNFYIYTSFGASLHFADWIGLNLKAGAFYLNIKESDNVMHHTTSEGISESFKVKFDEKSKILPAGELSLTLRF